MKNPFKKRKMEKEIASAKKAALDVFSEGVQNVFVCMCRGAGYTLGFAVMATLLGAGVTISEPKPVSKKKAS